MEGRFGWDFSRVRVHTDSTAAESARQIDAKAYTAGQDIVFGCGRFSPSTSEGRRLLAHELTHVVQQSVDATFGRLSMVRREGADFVPVPTPEDLVESYRWQVVMNRFGEMADRLYLAAILQPSPYRYVRKVLDLMDSDYRDNLGAAFVSRLSNDQLARFAESGDGRNMLNVLYEEIITGSVSTFEREQANRILVVKASRYSPDEYALRARIRPDGKPTRIFPVRFMRVTGGDYAPPSAQLLANGNVRVRYVSKVQWMDTFKDEVKTLGNAFSGSGLELNPNEVVGIKDYERGGVVLYLPAIALIDYSNQAIQSTTGKIIEVSAFAATMGVGGGAVAGGRAAAAELTTLARWTVRAAKAARFADRVADIVGIASFVINENRDWIVSKLGSAGRRLVQISDIANSVAGIYGMGRLAQGLGAGGYKIFKDLREASKAARAEAKALKEAELKVLQKLDEETDAMLKELEAQTSKRSAPGGEEATKGPSSQNDSLRPTDKGDGSLEPPRAKVTRQSAAEEISTSASTHGIPVRRLQDEVADLRRQTSNPKNVRRPSDSKLDAEMTSADSHGFDRNRETRTWCRRSEEACELKLGAPLNADVDSALANKQNSRQQPVRKAGDQSSVAPGHVAPHAAGSSPHRVASTPTPDPATQSAPPRAWNDPGLVEDFAVDLYMRSGVKKPLPDGVVRKRIQEGYRFNPSTRRWSKPHKVRTRVPRAPTEPFLRDALQKISDQKHPLHGLVEAKTGVGGGVTYDWIKTTRVTKKGKAQVGRYPGNETGPVIQVGHPEAFASGAPERHMLEDADANVEFGGNMIESKGAFSFKVAVNVDGVLVDLASLQQWERLGVVPAGTVAKAVGLP